MSRHFVCEVCTNPIPELEVTTLQLHLKGPVKGGIPAPPIKADVDLCSQECLTEYLTKKALSDLATDLGKWRDVGVLPQKRRMLGQ